MAKAEAEKLAANQALTSAQKAKDVEMLSDKTRAEALYARSGGRANDQEADVSYTVKGFSYTNGDTYTGTMVNGEPHGEGKMVMADGTTYEGRWAKGKHSGPGVKIWMDGITYNGQWENGMMHGQGKYTSKLHFHLV